MSTSSAILAATVVLAVASPPVHEPKTYLAGVVHGPQAAFELSAPEGWVLDTTSGADQDEPCVLYPRGSTWLSSDVVMYAKLASETNRQREDFMAWALEEFKKDDPGFQFRYGRPGTTQDGYAFAVLEYIRPSYPLFERVAYIQFPNAVAYIVYSATNWNRYLETSGLLESVLKTIRYRPDFIDSPSQQEEK